MDTSRSVQSIAADAALLRFFGGCFAFALLLLMLEARTGAPCCNVSQEPPALAGRHSLNTKALSPEKEKESDSKL